MFVNEVITVIKIEFLSGWRQQKPPTIRPTPPHSNCTAAVSCVENVGLHTRDQKHSVSFQHMQLFSLSFLFTRTSCRRRPKENPNTELPVRGRVKKQLLLSVLARSQAAVLPMAFTHTNAWRWFSFSDALRFSEVNNKSRGATMVLSVFNLRRTFFINLFIFYSFSRIPAFIRMQERG